MSDVAVHHHEAMADAYEPSLFGTYSKKIGMCLNAGLSQRLLVRFISFRAAIIKPFAGFFKH